MIQFEGHPATVCSLAFSPDSMTLASGAKDGWVKVWSADGATVFAECMHGDFPPPIPRSWFAITWAMSGEWLTYANGDGLCSVGPFPKSDVLIPKIHKGGGFPSVSSLSFVSHSLLALGQGLGGLTLLDTTTKKAKAIPPTINTSHGIKVVTAHPPTKRLHWIAGLPNTTACVWRSWCITSPNANDVKLGKPAQDIAVSVDGGTVAIASDWIVRVYTADGKPRCDLTGHKGQVAGVGFVHGGRTVVSASWDETVRFWDVATSKETARFPLKVGKLTALAVSPDGTRVATGGTDGPIVLIDAE